MNREPSSGSGLVTRLLEAARRGEPEALARDTAGAGEFEPAEMLGLEREIAAVLEISERTVHHDWMKARAWLYRWLYAEPKA